jgi:hypothetical protein
MDYINTSPQDAIALSLAADLGHLGHLDIWDILVDVVPDLKISMKTHAYRKQATRLSICYKCALNINHIASHSPNPFYCLSCSLHLPQLCHLHLWLSHHLCNMYRWLQSKERPMWVQFCYDGHEWQGYLHLFCSWSMYGVLYQNGTEGNGRNERKKKQLQNAGRIMAHARSTTQTIMLQLLWCITQEQACWTTQALHNQEMWPIWTV